MLRPLPLFILALAASAVAQTTPDVTFSASTFTLSRPVSTAYIPGDPRLFVVEQRSGTTGRIRVVEGSILRSTPVLTATVSTGSEQGLLGLAFHPDFANNRHLFVNLTNSAGNTVIRRYTMTTTTSNVAASPLDLLTLTQPYSNHNGGSLNFGPDGYLWIGMGDGGSANDPENRAQTDSSYMGKFLRIDPNVTGTVPAYTVPSDNPRSALTVTPEAFSKGWRNPWQWSFDDLHRNGFGGKFVADVGQSAFEEISYQRPVGRLATGTHAYENYGWRVLEGNQVTGLGGGTGPYVAPIFAYNRSFGISISGGVLYRGAALGPELYGRFFFSDFGSPELFSLKITFDPVTNAATATDQQSHGIIASGVASVRVDSNGELVMGTNGTQIVRASGNGVALNVNLVHSATTGPVPFARLDPELVATGRAARYPFALRPVVTASTSTFRMSGYREGYRLVLKPAGYLRANVPAELGFGAAAVNVPLYGGDVDGDNEVTILDYISLSSVYGSLSGGPTYLEAADFDRDGEVSIIDYLVLSENYERVGDPAI